jgi:hypothetical protein
MKFREMSRGAVLLAAAIGASAAYADGVCVKGYRDTTAAERQTMLAVMEAAKAALPGAPTGWIIGGYEELSPVGTICKDGENTPWAYSFSRTFNRTDDQAARDQALADAGAKMRAAQEARQPQIDALTARMQTLGAELGTASQKGDQARVDAINREFEKTSKQLEAIYAQTNDPALLESVAKATMQDRTMSIGIRVNPGAISNADMKKSQAPAGAHSAYRWTTSADGVSEGHALVLFGAWQPRAQGGVESQRRGTQSSAAAHAVAVRVAADPARLDSLLASIDFGAIAATLAR